MREGAVRVPVRPTASPGGSRLSTVTGVVLAGGRSTRFGTDKLAADLEGRPLLHHAVTRVAEVCDEIVLVLAPAVDPPAVDPSALPVTVPVRFAHDPREGEGPLAGLAAGLDVVASDLALVVAGDMPYLAPPVLAELIRVAGDADVDAGALAQGDRMRPLPCVVASVEARANAHALLRAGERGARSVRGLLGTLRVAVVDEDTWRRLDPAGGTLHDVDEPGDLRSIG